MLRTLPSYWIPLLLWILVISIPVRAQDTLIVKPGDRIRITLSPSLERTTGTVSRLEHDSLFFRPCRQCSVEGFPLALATSPEIRIKHGDHGILGAALGFLGGAALGAFVLFPCPEGNSGADGPPCGLGQMEGTVAGAVVGLFIGGIVGRWLVPSERWAPGRWP
jgi:hypothetical protein